MKKLLTLLLFLFVVSACTEDPFSDNNHRVGYLVSGTIYNATISYLDVDGKTIQDTVSVPWIYNFPVLVKNGTKVSISAENIGPGSGFVVRIFKDSDTFKESTAKGTQKVATAIGTI